MTNRKPKWMVVVTGLLAAILLVLQTGCAGSRAPGAPAAYAQKEAFSASDSLSAEVAEADYDPGAQPPPAPPPSPSMHGGSPPMARPGHARPVSRPRPTGKSPNGKAKTTDPASASSKVGIAQMLIFVAQLHLQVDSKRFAVSIDAVVDIAVAMGGYISKQDNRSVTVRVPSARFRDAMKEMEKLGDDTHRSVQAQDVSEEYHDLSIRLKSLLATRKRIEEFLKKAKTIAEVLQIEKQLARLNGEVDRIQGRMRYLAARAALSTITVALKPKPKKQIVVDPVDPPLPPARSIPLPIDWLSSVGLDRLLQLR